MHFKNFNLTGDFFLVATDKEKRRFKEAQVANSDKGLKSRKWVKDVLMVFADKSNLEFAQAVQLIKSGQAIRGKAIHKRHGAFLRMNMPDKPKENADQTIWELLDKEAKLYEALGGMADHDYEARVRVAFSFALSVRHEDDAVPKGKGASKNEADKSQVADATTLNEVKAKMYREHAEAAASGRV